MTYTIVLSGPKASEPQARTALASAGYTLHPGAHDHGLADHPEGKDARQAVAFITCENVEDVNGPGESAASLKYRLRMHHETPEPPSPSAEQQLRQELDRLTARLAKLEDAA